MYGGVSTSSKDGFTYIVLIVSIYRQNLTDQCEISICSGSLIRKDLILTAAHCVNNTSVSKIELYAGLNYDTDPPKWTYLSEAKSVSLYPKEEGSFNGDLAIIESLNHFDGLKTVKLPTKPFPIEDQSCWILGFGDKSFDDSKRDLRLRKLLVNPKHPHKCSMKSIFLLLKIEFICYSIPDNGFGPCKGDSGGPLLCENESNELSVYGVLSRRTLPVSCGKGDSVALYENVYSYNEWIDSFMDIDSSPPTSCGNSHVTTILLYLLIATYNIFFE